MHFSREIFKPPIVTAPLLNWGMAILLLTALSACVPTKASEVELPKWNGVWVGAKSIVTPGLIDEVIQRAEAGNFDAIFVNVFYDGHSLYDSAFVEKYHKVDAGFDPLAYLVPQAHQRGITVHAWYVVGRIDEPDSAILQAHPNWSLVGPDGESIPWLNLGHSEVQGFISDLMMETVERYEVDGIHFDYTRYPGSEWGFDPYTIREFTNEYGIDLNQLRYADLPAYGSFEGNPLTRPDSAEVLASFGNGVPAVAINQYGEGESILLNWKADRRAVAVSSEILQRSLQRLLDSGKPVYILRSKTNGEEYGYGSLEQTMEWLEYLGWEVVEVSEAEIDQLETKSALVLPNIYLISEETAVHLADFVHGGGGVIFIDGPTKSIHLKEIQEITGMSSRGVYFKENMLLTSTDLHPLIPVSQRDTNLEGYQNRDSAWREFRKQGINKLIRGIYERIKTKHPGVIVSITITSDQEEAGERYLQDWQTWLQDGYVDLLIPRGYVDDANQLGSILNDWRPVIHQYDSKITFGLISYIEHGESVVSKPPEQLSAEMEMTLRAGSNGLMIFDLGRMSDDQLSALKNIVSQSQANP